MPSFISQLLATLRVADAVDVALVAAFLYALLSWLRRSTSQAATGRLAATALIFGAVYLLANLFELLLVERLLRTLFLVALIAGVVVFQSEIRRLLSRLGTFNPFASPVSPDEATIDQLVEAAAYLADANVGALIALKGQEPWDDLMQGGVPLGGQLSQPLLYSLFDPGTAGHDGAVLVEGRRVTRFAVHLPPATDLPSESRFGGTRHAAALGLSEHCDALVIAVSEERGAVSVAQGGRLDELAAPGDLKERLASFWQQHHAPAERRWSQRWLPKLQTASFSLVLALLLWGFFAYSPDTVSRTLSVPVEFRDLPDNWELRKVSPEAVQVTLVGPERVFTLLDRATLAASFDLTTPREGVQRFTVSEEGLGLPAGVRLNSVNPQQVRAETRQLVRAEVSVEVPTLGSLPGSLELTELRAEPQTVTLLIPSEVASRPQRILTEPLDLREATRQTTVARPLVLPPRWHLPEDGDSNVEVSVRVRE